MQHLSLKENAYKIIKQKILNGEIAPGERIREDLLAEEISISRTPVREAINKLIVEDLVRNEPRKGIYCIDLKPDYINHILDVRETLEVLSICECIDNIDESSLHHLTELNERLKIFTLAEKYLECNLLDGNFHNEIARLSKNPLLFRFLSEIRDLVHIMRFMEYKIHSDKNHFAYNDHKILLNEIMKKDKKSASEQIRMHINRMKNNLGINDK